MSVLAFDTCLGAVSVAVRWRGGGGEWLLRDAYEPRDRGQAERLMPMIAAVMAEAGLDFADLGRIAVTAGPGSFTGVRVGVAAARGLALASGKPIVATSSLAVMARQAVEALDGRSIGTRLALAVDARRDMVFLQLFDGTGSETGPPAVLAPDEAAARVGAGPAIVAGSAAVAVVRAIRAAGGEAEAVLADLQPSARALAAMADSLSPAGRLQPLYLRPPDAKPQDDKSLPRAAP